MKSIKLLTKSKYLILLIGSVYITNAFAVPNPSVSFLQKQYGITAIDAKKRIDLQKDIIELSEKLNNLNDPDYADMYIQHDPVYKIIVLFSDNKDRFNFLKSLDPKLQSVVQIRQAKKSRKVYTTELDLINERINSLNFPFSSLYSLEKEKFIITVENKRNLDLVKNVLPKQFNGETILNIGNIPKIEAAPTGVQAGDRLYGGTPVWTHANATGGWCTLGYAVSYISGGVTKKGVVTAGHCDNAMFANVNGHDVLLSGPIVDKRHKDTTKGGDGISDKYDYQIWDGTGLALDNQVKYKDINGIPEFPANGIFRLTSVTTFVNQKAGMIVCKSGHTTGITCGEITNGNASHDGVAGWIQVGKSNQANISAGGDSGGPWFLYPGSSSTISGVGIHTAGNAATVATDFAIYMPIDYIDDHISSVNTIKQ